ncbi:DeoR family transcriptional regulator [Granulicatella sp. zg-ZJ]|uniref:DeoR/GlpR family DNA-binding transcription regulator n=1 Tax=unclassified Granulicatella TaxID=2630493 RepID=UPI0013C2779F|nr:MULTISPECIES: DeoR/GlpR family DNA-binding transcription regulator [unclassified Granulicatella]MBS4750361.1 DeoR/GlpR transcriptional regulator [Carnobacteriaceae bacterium zg-ZUI78]NEW63239.1 DeoR family transcriptional regulator [Granulicatella sp. zg-ZJ]NEW65975.1 DeoR family transcriptional regulator [Granulicatella sp. zg-84]QMI85880.1 DeoR/GlpR transcriptional regulator [Carnobacteriaceae bacterium zg-84]
MLSKEERLEAIIKLVDTKGSIRVSDIVDNLNVSDMTVRRDLTELEESGFLVRTHGGARSKNVFQHKELSHDDKHMMNIEEKKEIASKALELIEEGDTVFLGPGTTVAMLADKIVKTKKSLRVITNCLPIYNILMQEKSENIEIYLLGGEMREVTKSFCGDLTNMILSQMRFSKIFFSSNGVKDNAIMTSTFKEGYTQQMALNNSLDKYLLIDTSKIGKEDFSAFYTLDKISGVIINGNDAEYKKELSAFTKVF